MCNTQGSNFGDMSFPSMISPVKTGGSGNFAERFVVSDADDKGVASQLCCTCCSASIRSSSSWAILSSLASNSPRKGISSAFSLVFSFLASCSRICARSASCKVSLVISANWCQSYRPLNASSHSYQNLLSHSRYSSDSLTAQCCSCFTFLMSPGVGASSGPSRMLAGTTEMRWPSVFLRDFLTCYVLMESIVLFWFVVVSLGGCCLFTIEGHNCLVLWS